MLVQLGTCLLGLAFILSLWASADRATSLPWFIIAMFGVLLVLLFTGRPRSFLARRITALRVIYFFVACDLLALVATLLTSNWQSSKLPWLDRLFTVLPSIRSLPYSWAQQGLAANQTGGLLAVLTAFVAVLATSPSPFADRGTKKAKSYRAATVVLAVVSAGVVYMTGSRAALVGLVIAVLVNLVIRSTRWIWVWTGGLAAALAGLAISRRLLPLAHALVYDEALSTKLVARLDIWVSSLKAIEDNFFTGIGIGTFNKIIPVRYPYQTVGLSFDVSQSHNLFLDVAVSTGIPGLIGLLLLFAGVVLMAARALHGDLVARLVALGVLASMTAFVVYGLTDSMAFSRPTSFIIWLWPCALALVQPRSSGERTTT